MSQNKDNKQPGNERKPKTEKDLMKNMCYRCLQEDHVLENCKEEVVYRKNPEKNKI